eukprot:TRINITY_DN5172_c0_g1_i1.p1 TRINITY_DN5172_c0_g1~~TRINITY_DN5172_c0_g1_i1.p1  ORF type:complete len:231 (+),score=48.29 TRINITY_DN5172_c0_g1_i1:791-1483(+)
MRSQQHSLQKTTNSGQVAYKMIKEANKHPKCELRLAKDDIVKAFNLVAIILAHIGLFATSIGGIVCVNLVMIFGSEVSPGDFEPYPEVARWVDDLLSIIAMFGDRAPDHLQRLREVIVGIYGEKGHNLVKQGIEGEPWSKIIKVSHLTLDFVNCRDPTAPDWKLNMGQIEEIRGVLHHAMTWCPGQARILHARFNVMLSDAARKHPRLKHTPKEYIPDPRLKGEEDSQLA